MICNNCNKLNDEDNKYCEYCGNKLDSANVNNQVYDISADNKGKKSFLPWISLGLLCFSVVVFIPILMCFFNILFISIIPFVIIFLLLLIASLVLSIVSRVDNHDSMSLVIMILSIVFIGLFLAFIVYEISSGFCECINTVNDFCEYSHSSSCG